MSLSALRQAKCRAGRRGRARGLVRQSGCATTTSWHKVTAGTVAGGHARNHENRSQRLENQAKSGQGVVPGWMCQSLDKVISGLRTMLLVPTSPKVEEEERSQEVMGASVG